MKEIQLAMPGSRLSMTPETLMIAFDRPRRSLSTAIYGGGFRNIRYALNQKLTAFYPSEKIPGRLRILLPQTLHPGERSRS